MYSQSTDDYTEADYYKFESDDSHLTVKSYLKPITSLFKNSQNSGLKKQMQTSCDFFNRYCTFIPYLL